MAAEISPQQPPQELLFARNAEYEYCGNPDVFVAMHVKQQLLKEQKFEEAAKYRIGVICEGGGHAVSNEEGPMEEFSERAYFEDGVIDVVAGASGGSVVMINAVVGNKNAEKIFEENCENNFFNPRNMLRPTNGRRGLINFSGFRASLERHSAQLDTLKQAKPEMYAYVVDGSTGEQRRINIKELPEQKNLNDVIFASCCIPVVGDLKFGHIDGVAHIDGGLPGIDVGQFVKDFNLTHVLLLRSFPINRSEQERRAAHAFHKLSQLPGVRGNTSLREGLSSYKKGMENLARTFLLQWTEDDLALGIFAPQERVVDVVCMDMKKIRSAISRSRQAMKTLLEEHLPPIPFPQQVK